MIARCILGRKVVKLLSVCFLLPLPAPDVQAHLVLPLAWKTYLTAHSLFDGVHVQPWDGTAQSLPQQPCLIWLPHDHPERSKVLKESWRRGHFPVFADRAVGVIRVKGKVYDLSECDVVLLLKRWRRHLPDKAEIQAS